MSGDLESGLAAASAVGDDRIQKETMGAGTPREFHSWDNREVLPNACKSDQIIMRPLR